MMQNIRVAVDAVVFGYANHKLYVLLIQQKFGGNQLQWALPGGLVQNDETLKAAVERELKEETNVSVKYLEQLYTFGDDVHRDHRNRVISVAYLALVDSSNIEIQANTDALDVAWFPVDELPDLAFDHNTIVHKGLQRLQAKLTYEPIGFDLLPQTFLFSDLEALYTSILKKEIDRRNFRKKMLGFGILEETEFYCQQKAGRPAKLFQFKPAEYQRLQQEGFYFEIKFV